MEIDRLRRLLILMLYTKKEMSSLYSETQDYNARNIMRNAIADIESATANLKGLLRK